MELLWPYLVYRDASEAIEWLGRAFGFTETLRYTESDGRVSHAELSTPRGAGLMLGSVAPDEAAEPGSVNSFVVVEVDDVQAHHDHAIAEGAQVLRPLRDLPYGVRAYSTRDLDGFRWDFQQHVADVAPEEWGAVSAG